MKPCGWLKWLLVAGVSCGAGTVEAQTLSPGLSLLETAGTMGAGNLARRNGATAFAQDLIPGYAIHQVAHLNDGIYGNDNSWIGDSADTYAGIELKGSFLIDGLAFGSDNTGGYGDRWAGTYTIQYTTSATPTALTPESAWITIGAASYTDFYAHQGPLRHRYGFEAVQATGVRVKMLGGHTGIIRIDELEVYGSPVDTSAVPEPSAAMLFLPALAVVAFVRRSRSTTSVT